MKRTKKITKALTAIASGLPAQRYAGKGYVGMTGKELIKAGIHKDEYGFPIDPEKSYVVKQTETFQVNHVNRLKSAWDAGGIEAVKNYLRPMVKPERQAEFFDRLQKTLE